MNSTSSLQRQVTLELKVEQELNALEEEISQVKRQLGFKHKENRFVSFVNKIGKISMLDF